MVGELITIERETYNSVAADAKFTITSTDDPGEFIKNEQTPAPGKPGGPQQLGSMLSKLGGISGSLTSALNFKNIVSNVFPFETPPVAAMSDFYTFARGAAALPDGQLPSMKGIGDAANKIRDDVPIPDWDLLDSESIYRPMQGKIWRAVGLETQRGCAYTCTFCNSPSNNVE